MKYKNCRGFTLIEMAMVFVIMALLLGGGLTILRTQLEQQRIRDTQRLLDEARDALIGFAVFNGRLPRPAISAVNGVENTANCPSDLVCTGLIPWVTLGTTRADAWGKILRYSVTPAFSSDSPLPALTTLGTKNIETRNNAGALVPLANSVPVVIFSHGEGRWGTTEAGVAIADGSDTNVDEDINQTGGALGATFRQRTINELPTATGGEFDDMVIWIPTGVLFNRMVQAGRFQ